jgi:hypothetical protein
MTIKWEIDKKENKDRNNTNKGKERRKMNDIQETMQNKNEKKDN